MYINVNMQNTLIYTDVINTYIQTQNHAQYSSFLQLKLLQVTKALFIILKH